EIVRAPLADPGLAIGRDVRRVESAERGRQRATTGVRPAFGAGVTSCTIAEDREIFTVVSRGSGRTDGCAKECDGNLADAASHEPFRPCLVTTRRRGRRFVATTIISTEPFLGNARQRAEPTGSHRRARER